ncbi:ferritin-like domain-containing protein [Arthrobacter sp. D1-29]
MNDDSQEKRPRGRYFRYAVLSLTALLVLSLGIALIPHEPPPPPEPPFSEQARAAAFADAVSLRSSIMELAGPAADPGTPGSGTPDPASGRASGHVILDRVVTLLTFQARALMLPPDGSSAEAGATAAEGAGPGTASAEPSPTAAAPVPPSPAELVAALSASGAKRLSDAGMADGGMARLLAGTGAAQLLAATELAAFAGVPAPALPSAVPHSVPSPSELSPSALPPSELSPSALPGAGGTEGAAEGAPDEEPDEEGTPGRDSAAGLAANCGTAEPSAGTELAAALTSAVEAELEAVYGYQAALTRLDPALAAAASDLLEQHHDLVERGVYYSRIHCATIPPPQPGYVLSQAFLDAPAAGLGRIEASTLPVYGDVVAMSQGATRQWAISALLNAARRTVQWGADPGPLPGLSLDESQLPQLPA